MSLHRTQAVNTKGKETEWFLLNPNLYSATNKHRGGHVKGRCVVRAMNQNWLAMDSDRVMWVMVVWVAVLSETGL